MDLKDYIGITEGFPKPGISWKDVSPLLANPEALRECIRLISAWAQDKGATLVVGPESRGFLFGCPVAYEMGLPFAMARKKGKLPGKTHAISYQLEYGEDIIEISASCLKEGDRVLLVDDLMATGGTLLALETLVKNAGAEVAGIATVIELTDFGGVNKVDAPFLSLVKYPH